MPAWETYYQELISRGHGHAVWDADPGEEPAVEVADVGYMEEGAFVRLFNASKEIGDQSNKFGTPEGYEPIHIGAMRHGTLSAIQPITSETVRQRRVAVSVSGGSMVQSGGGGGFTFECTKEQGAALILREDAHRTNALQKTTFTRYVRENHSKWLKLANNVHERGISADQLLMVTGCDKTSEWACAAFLASSSQIGLEFQIGNVGVAQGGVSVWGSWNHCQSVEVHSGPSSRVRQTTSSDYQQITNEPETNSRNQCVFLRGYKLCDRSSMTRRMRLLGRKKTLDDGFMQLDRRKGDDKNKPQGSSGSSNNGSPGISGGSGIQGSAVDHGGGTADHGSGSESISNNGSQDYLGFSIRSQTDSSSSFDTGQSDSELSLDQCNGMPQLTHLDILMQYILENSSADLALVHHDDLTSMLEDLTPTSDFEGILHQVQPHIFVDNCVGMLESTFKASNDAESSNLKTSIPTVAPSKEELISHEQEIPLHEDVRTVQISTISPERQIIRRATGALVKAMLPPSSGTAGTRTTGTAGTLAKPPLTLSKDAWDAVEGRMHGLARLESIWRSAGGTGGGGEGSGGAGGLTVHEERKAFGAALKDGYVLCQYLNAVSLAWVCRPDPSVTSSSRAANLAKFAAAAMAFGVPPDAMFEWRDLEGGITGLARVAKCVMALERLAGERAMGDKAGEEVVTDTAEAKPGTPPLPSPGPRTVTKSPSSAAVGSTSAMVYTTHPVGSASTPNVLATGGVSPSRSPAKTTVLARRVLSPLSHSIPVIMRQKQMTQIQKQRHRKQSSPSALFNVKSSSPADGEGRVSRKHNREGDMELQGEDGDVFGPMTFVDGTVPLSPQRVGERSSIASSSKATDTTSAHSSLLDHRWSTNTRYWSIRTMPTDATSLGTDVPSLTRTKASAIAADLDMGAANAPATFPPTAERAGRRMSSPYPTRSGGMVNLGGTNDFSKGETSLIGGMDGSAVRNCLVVKEEGKLATHYQLGNCIGRGQFGSVYRALNLNTGKMAAVRRIRLEGLSEREVAQLTHEVEIVRRLSHPSIVKYEGMAKDSNTLSIVLEYAENGSLAQTLKVFGKLNEGLVASYVTKVLEGLHYLHTSQVVHCDLKAANILTTKTGHVKLSDFGVSLNLRVPGMELIKNDIAANWMAPEVIELRGASPASDIWSLACTIIELLTGRPPYADVQNRLSVMFRIVGGSMPPIPEGLSEPLRDFLTCCFNKDPAQRPNAEMLFEHPWLKSEWGLYKELRPQDSIPFLRRVSADFQRSDVRHLTFLEENGASSLRSSNGFSSTTEFPPRPHTFVKSTLGLAVTCEVCDQPVRKSAVRCAECSLIAHSKCAAEAPQTCDLRSQVIRISQDKQREAVRQQIPPPNPVNNLSSSPPEFSSRPYFRKKSKTHGLVADVTESSEPIRLPSAFRYDDTNVTKPKIFSRPQNSNNDDRSRSRASVASKQESSSKHSTATGSHTSGIADAGARVRSVSMAESELHHDSRITDSSMASEPVMNAGVSQEPYLKRKGSRRVKKGSDSPRTGCLAQ